MRCPRALFLAACSVALFACRNDRSPEPPPAAATDEEVEQEDAFAWQTEQFADLRILRY